ncbi:unnamed protein product [Candidula unifasciata]|uniref:WAP domain-containing protein n=1 Tax=Candidula unifasciata TaxID=100452 RepID=A0A8S3YEG7_9EUPU|nr:unnamed protein product [Candidula unifasciata]
MDPNRQVPVPMTSKDRTSFIGLWLYSLSVTTVRGQGDSVCPVNSAMGLCTELAKTCFSDSDCYSGEICCPEACSRTCKSRHATKQSSEGSIPDLLNDPRVYVGKCPDASCYSMFGGDPNECSTSKLCPGGQYCCNDGCKNVCLWKPEYASAIAQEQARARQHQQMLIQKQQVEMRRKQQEMYIQRQRQLVSLEQARQRAEARAAAEVELLAQQKRASFEANLRAAAANQVKISSKQLGQTVAQLNTGNQQTSNQLSLQSSPAKNDFLSNFENKPQTNNTGINLSGSSLAPQQTASTAIAKNSTPLKKDNLPVSFSNHINSPASLNPHNNFRSQQNVGNKDMQEPLTISQSVGFTSEVQVPKTMTVSGSVNPVLTYLQSLPGAKLANTNLLRQASSLRAFPTNLLQHSSSLNSVPGAYSGSSNSISTFINRHFPQQSQNNVNNQMPVQSQSRVVQQIPAVNAARNQSPAFINRQQPFVTSNQNQSPGYPRPNPYQGLGQRMSYLAQTPDRVNQRKLSLPVAYRAAGQRQQQPQQSAGSLSGRGYQSDNMNTYLMFDMMQTAV